MTDLLRGANMPVLKSNSVLKLIAFVNLLELRTWMMLICWLIHSVNLKRSTKRDWKLSGRKNSKS